MACEGCGACRGHRIVLVPARSAGYRRRPAGLSGAVRGRLSRTGRERHRSSGKDFFINPEAAGQYVLSQDQAIGKIARKTLLPGKPILVSALGEPSLVKRGVPARLVFTSGMLTITAMGTPLESGTAGDFIKVRNSDSGIIVSGTVLADGRIQVGMQ